MFVDGVPVLVTASQCIKFITVKHMPQQTVYHFKQSLLRMMQVYARAGCTVQTILIDRQFEPLKQQVEHTSLEHIGEIEHTLRVINEHARAITSGLPYQRMPKRILIELINFVVFWLNAFPAKNRILPNLSPWKIIIRQPVDYGKH
ncbi:hypothetical protein ACHAXS_003633 [Conticribra weissflogii]